MVFKRVDHWTGDARYIYHGNDGTSMPWNDTAQLNYLNPEVREAVIQTILAVARRSPIIRFDAAMTLTKKHFQRLWFPEPGTGGDIASRADFGMTKADFDAAMPEEFWREVVDRVAEEAPDTLLLAEAFWMMEGYFVRTLGMHRVYNSAFMNMLRDEKNAEYRQLIKNTLEFDPQILKRYVNFMNNPDERTAVDQFGKGDKYFGVCTTDGDAAGPADVRSRAGRGLHREVRHGIPPRLLERDARRRSGGAPRAAAFPAAAPSRALRRSGRFPALRLLHGGWLCGRERLRLLEPAGRRAFAGALPQHLCRDVVAGCGPRSLTPSRTRTARKRSCSSSLAEGLDLTDDADTFLIFRDAVTGLEYIRNVSELVRNGAVRRT